MYYAQLEKSYPNPAKAFFFFLICLTPEEEDLKSKNVRGKTNSVFSQMFFRSPFLLLLLLFDNQNFVSWQLHEFQYFLFFGYAAGHAGILDPLTRGLKPAQGPLQWEAAES